MSDSATNFTGDLRVPHIEESTNGYPVDVDKVVVGGVTYYRQRVSVADTVGLTDTQLRASAVPTSFSDSANFDAFSRLRTSPPNVIFDSTLEYGIPEDWVQTVTGAATITYLPNERSADLTVASGETARTRTKNHFRYTPGQSMLFFMTGVMGQSANTTRSIGYFDDENGLGFRHNGTTAGIFKRSFTSGSAVDTFVAQADWNIDKLDGTGPSGVTVDWTKTQIFVIDFQWLGVGRIRYGLDLDGQIRLVHETFHANNETTVYMTNANLHMTYEIISTTGTGTLKHICCCLMTEGGTSVITEDHADAIASGRYAGGNSAPILGYLANVPAGSGWNDLCSLGVAIIPLPAAGGVTMEVVSASVNDAAGTGTGIRTVEIHGLDANWDEQDEQITMNGTTAVASTKTWLRINFLHALTTGSLGVSAGNITIQGTGAGTAYCRIRAGGNASNQALYSVPRRKEASIEGWTIASVVDDKSVFGKIALRANVDWKSRDTLVGTFLYQKELVIAETTGHFIFAPHLAFPPMCDIKISAEKLAGGVKNLVATGNFTVVTRYL